MGIPVGEPPSKGIARPSPSLIDFLQERAPHFHIVDVEALWPGDEPYSPLLRAEHARVGGFEPIAQEYDALNQKFGPSNVRWPYAIGDGSRRRFHRCNYSMTSSV